MKHVSGILKGLSSVLLLSLAAAGSLAAQEEERQPPETWKVRTDGGGHGGGNLYFVEMPPGWHITTGPACILYDPANAASGTYRAETEIFLFDPGRRREGFGLFFGGADLEGDGVSYVYFLIRRDGRYLIKRRQGAGTSTVQGWTEHAAIVTWDARGEGEETAKNSLAVEVGTDEVAFLINGQRVAAIPRSELQTDGVVGLRVNHNLNLHVAKLEIRS